MSENTKEHKNIKTMIVQQKQNILITGLRINLIIIERKKR